MTKPIIYDSIDCQWPQVAIGSGTQTFWYAMRRATVPNVLAGDVFHIYGEGQLRNDTGWNVELAQLLTVHPVYLTTFYNNTTPEQYGIGSTQPINGWNIAPAEHYGRWSKGAWYTAPTDMQNMYVTMWVRGRSSNANGNQVLTVQQNQQFLQVAKFN